MANITACGTVSYQMFITSAGEPGFQHSSSVQHIISYLYEIEFGKDAVPRPGSDEVETLTLMTLDDATVTPTGF
ncbi:hypothetical protein C8A05DRAFT_35367 [Staphylotrichum tortipilum]|uniref:Uncharacterized protein n=1 Tax=Staphylotrichum tortipilum TaxID=2831512 RepID=A0AAN6RSL2_9PEZI|nr:hypothetical protein C8A05DRAFT_35367 [Staphylotrichum longicolle]